MHDKTIQDGIIADDTISYRIIPSDTIPEKPVQYKMQNQMRRTSGESSGPFKPSQRANEFYGARNLSIK